MDPEGNGVVKINSKGKRQGEEGEYSSDDSVAPEVKHLQEMEAGMDEYYQRQKEYKMEIDR
jgi:hypothetical protein